MTNKEVMEFMIELTDELYIRCIKDVNTKLLFCNICDKYMNKLNKKGKNNV